MSAKEREQSSAGSRKQEDSERPAEESIPSLEGEKESLPNAESASLKSDDQTTIENGTSDNQEQISERSGSEGGQDVTEGGEESIKNGTGSTTNGAADDMPSGDGAMPGNSGEETYEESGSSFSSSEVHSSKRGRGRKKKEEPSVVVPDGEHTVTLSVVIAKAIPTVTDPDIPKLEDVMRKKKQRIVEAPKAQGYYHCQYFLLPEDAEPIRTDVVTFGMAAKIYTEHDSKVLKTWQEGELTWIAWSHSHKLHVTKDLLLRLFDHTLELRIWESREKVSAKARFDRPKAFRLPQGKPGDDAQDVGGVRSLVLKQSRSYEALQPKKSSLDRPVPRKGPPELGNMTQFARRDEKGRPMLESQSTQSLSHNGSKMDSIKPAHSSEHSLKPHNKEPESKRKMTKPESTTASKLCKKNTPTPSPTKPKDGKQRKLDNSAPAQQGKENGEENGDGKAAMTPRSGTRRMFKDSPMQREAKRKSVKAEHAAAAHALHVKKYGNTCIPVRMKLLFADLKSVTSRLDQPVVGIKDVFITVSVDGPLMSPDQRRDLNPLVIKVASALSMPSTPLSYAELERRCLPVHTAYKFYKQPEYRSVNREHGKNIYWDDMNVELLGVIPRGELREYLQGAPLEIQVHDRDRRPEDVRQKPMLFGEDTEDDKISNVGMVASKRTTHNPFKGRIKPWDPYGVAKLDLSGLLLGEKIIYQTAPIHNCPLPDILGRGGSERLVGVANAADGPKDEPLPVGHYIDSGARLKVRLEVAHPITTPQEVHQKPEMDTPTECPFSRIIYIFGYKNTQFLHQLLRLVTSINAQALDLQHLPDHIIEAAISTYKLSPAQQTSPELDIVTGFQILDGEKHVFVLEGLRDCAISLLWRKLPRPKKQDGVTYEALYNSDMMFSERKYAALDVDLCRIKLHEPLSVIVKQPLLYVRDMVPRPCFQALIKLDQLVSQDKLRSVTKNDLFPSAESVISLSREFGVPLTTTDFEDLKEREEPVYLTEEALRSHSASQALPRLRPRRVWPPLELYNPDYIMYKDQLELIGPMHDFIKENINNVNKMSEENAANRVKPRTIHCDPPNGVAHNYSTQTLNATEQAKELLRHELAQEPERRFTYCKDYNSASVVPVNEEAVKRAEEERSRGQWQTEGGFVYPGIPSSMESNVHDRKPDPARRDELKQSWIENTLHANVLKPTLEYRSRYTWSDRNQDMNVWKKPLPGGFQPVPPITIHLAGDTLKAEKQSVKDAEHALWSSKVKVYDARMHFHRVAPETELLDEGFKSSNQVDRLRGLLKDNVQKLSLQRENFREVPALAVVANPSVDTAARDAGLPIPAVSDDRASMLGEKPTFMPGAFPDASLAMNNNRIPIKDMEHAKFEELKGYDFRLYHKDRGPVYKRQIKTLSYDDRDNHLFRALPPESYKEPSKLRPGNECFRKPSPAIRPDPIHTEFYYPDREKFLTTGHPQKTSTKKKILESAM